MEAGVISVIYHKLRVRNSLCSLMAIYVLADLSKSTVASFRLIIKRLPWVFEEAKNWKGHVYIQLQNWVGNPQCLNIWF